MQGTTEFRTNRDLFSNHYLDEHLPETDAWESVDASELQEAYDDIVDLWERERDLVADRNESQLEEKFIRPMFRKLGVPFEVEESVEQGQRRPDYGFFESDEGARNAFTRRRDGGDFYKNAVAVADAKRWGRKLDTRGEQQRDFENPSYQIHVYLQETPTTWAVLTNGEYWRLYYGPTSHRLDSYYEIHLPTVLESGDLEAFKYFYLFFHHEAFLPDTSDDCFLDDVYSESNVFAEELGEDLQDNIYDAIQSLAEGFLTYPENDLGADDLDLIHDSSLIYLYRLIFVLYAESEGRDLLNTDNEIYRASYSLNTIKQEVAEELDSDSPSYQSWQDGLWDRIDELFQLIDQGSASRNIPEEDLHIPAYNGGLFRTDPDPDDSREAQFLATHAVGDEYLARVIELLTRSQTGSSGKIFVDYSSLDVRHLGSIYEGLLEYQLNVADEPLTLDDGEYALADEGDEVIVEPGEVYLTTGSGERKATGSYYTPEYVVEYIVENTLGPLVNDIREDLVGNVSYDDDYKSGFAAEFAERIFDLKVLDPAMGSGHFLTNAIDYLAREIIDAQERQAEQQGVETVNEEHDINWARRQVAQRCIYGVDLNPLAVELAKVSLWLRTLAAEQPLAFLDHHLKTGNSLVGSDIEEIEELEAESGGNDQNTSLADFGVARKGTIEQLMRIYEDFIAIENQELADIKEMESKYDEFERNKLRQRLEAMANVHIAEDFGLDNLPSDAYERMAASLEDEDEWEKIQQMQWFRDAQKWSDADNYFHWKIEFPEVYYQLDGQSSGSPGFDAVIGNPPYVRQELITSFKDYLEKEFDVYHGRADIYAYFVEQALNLVRDGGRLSYILSHKFTKVKSGKGLRKLIDENQIAEFIDFQDLPVFGPEVSAYPAIMILSNKEPVEPFMYAEIDDLEFNSLPDRVQKADKKVDQSYFSDDEWTFLGQREREIKERVTDIGKPVVDAIGDPLVGVKSGLNEVLILDEHELSDLFRYSGGTELFRPIIFGKEIKRFRPPKPENHIMFPYVRTDDGVEVADLDNYEITREYLEQHKDDLVDRAIIEDKYPEGEMEWYELQQINKNIDPSKEKIVYPDISRRAHYTIDTSGSVVTTTGFILQSSDRYYLGLLNSSLLEWVLAVECAKARGGYLRPKAQYVGNLPIKDISPSERVYGSSGTSDRELAGEIEELSQELLDLNDELESLNLNLLDYIGGYDNGDSLNDIYLPAEGVSDSILADTTEERDSLRLGRSELRQDGENLTLLASARYKPEDPEEFETDQWGYTETDLIPAMKFIGRSNTEKILLNEFISIAVDEAGGFADFRETATSTNSPVDRLASLTLPDIESCRGGLERFAEVKSRSEKIYERIQEAEDQIDTRVFELYGVSDDDRELIEDALSGLIGE